MKFISVGVTRVFPRQLTSAAAAWREAQVLDTWSTSVDERGGLWIWGELLPGGWASRMPTGTAGGVGNHEKGAHPHLVSLFFTALHELQSKSCLKLE